MNASVIRMNIFDLKIKEFEKKIDKLLENISEKELLQELIKCGLVIHEKNEEEIWK